MSAPTQLMPLRLFYLLQFGALGAMFPFLPLLFAARGLAPAQISWVMVLMPLGNLLVPPLWGTLADMLGARLLLLQLAALGCAGSVWLLLPDWGLSGAALAMALLSFFRAPLSSLSDAATYAALEGRRAGFALVRVWGSVGFACFVLLMGLVEAANRPQLLVGVSCAIYLAGALSLVPMKRPPFLRERGVVRQSVALMRHPEMLLFLLASAVYYVGHASYDVFFSLHLRELGYPSSVLGTAWAVGVSVEIGLMLAAPRMMEHGRSARWLMLAAAVAVLRWSLVALVRPAPLLVGVQALHGVTFGLWYLARARFIENRAPEHLRASLQSLSISSLGLGMVLGYLGGGVLMQLGGGTVLYGAAALCASCALGLYWACGRQADAE